MGTLVSFHAHPDDEAIVCGGTLAKVAAEGHRVVLVFATRGEHGELPDGGLAPGETLGDRRTQETLKAAGILGASRVEFLGYVDSGVLGAPTNGPSASFCRADVDEAAHRVARILRAERADALTISDEFGVTGHPDHVQVHRVGLRAADMAATPRVYEATMSRAQGQRLLALGAAMGLEEPPIDIPPERFGTADEIITTTVDVRGYLSLKREAMAAHASQIFETSLFLSMPPALFAEVWGQEHFIRRGAATDHREGSLFGNGRMRGG